MKRFTGLTHMSIRTKLILGVAVVHLVLMTVFVMDLVHRQRVFLLQEATAAAVKQARLTASAATPWVLSDDLEGIVEVLETSGQDTPLRYALIVDPDGLVLAHTEHRLVGKYLADQASLNAIHRSGGAEVWQTDSQTIHAVAPILAGRQTIGFVLIGLDTTHNDTHLKYVSRNGFIYMLIAITAGTLFAYLMARFILRQLNLILIGVARIGDDRLDQPIPIISKDEIGKVGEALNRSMARLHHSREEIKRAVAERQQAEEDLRYLSQRLIGASEEERKRIGHDLHDELGQMITTFQFGLQSIAGMLGEGSDETALVCSQLATQAEKMGEAIHRVASFLWPATLEHLGLTVAVQCYLDDISQNISQLNMTFSSDIKKRLDPHVELVCFRIVQEAFTNIIRHSNACSVTISMNTQNGCFNMEIYDDGRGFQADNRNRLPHPKDGGIGILGMRERVDSLQGNLIIESSPGQGCRLLVSIPLSEDEAARKEQPE